jgi:hypothetical protein
MCVFAVSCAEIHIKFARTTQSTLRTAHTSTMISAVLFAHLIKLWPREGEAHITIRLTVVTLFRIVTLCDYWFCLPSDPYTLLCRQ